MLRDLIEHLLLHEFDGDNAVLGEMIAFIDYSVVALTKLFGAVYVEIVVHLLHALHWIGI